MTTPTVEVAALRDCPILAYAVNNFIEANCSFRSSVVIAQAQEACAACPGWGDLFIAPLQQKVFTLETALGWALFLRLAKARSIEEGDEPFPGEFDANEALTMLASVYDTGAQELVYAHFEGDEDEDSDDEDSDDEEEPEKEVA